jgi:RNA polymerase sigma-70 factor, ECF subfamily
MNYKLNNEEVINGLRNDNKVALEQLFVYFYPRLYNFSKAFLKDEEGIDDILQEVFLKIWERRKRIKNHDTFSSFIYTITKNLLLNELRGRINNQKMRDKIFEKCVAGEYLLSEKMDFQELKMHLHIFIDELPEKQKEIFTLSRHDGLSHREIAVRLNVSEKTVEYHIRQSITILKNRIKSIGLMVQIILGSLFM